MIKPNELRIGNYIEKGGVWLGVVAIADYSESKTISAFSEHMDCYDLPFSHFNPIPLSPSILEKCGFKYGMVKGIAYIDYSTDEEKEGDTEYWDKGDLTIVNWGKTGFVLSNKSSFDHRIELKSVHQLQNLYYALTQTELKIQLQP